MRNPFKKQDKLEEYYSFDIDELITELIISISDLRKAIKELRQDVDDLTDFVEDNLD